MKWPKIINDPVHSLISFEDTDGDRLLLDLINTREFQRLRRIKQLGMSELVFPGANHSRFAHSIGVMHMARTIVERIEQSNSGILNKDQRIIVLAAALLHDLGHGPFSHTFEKITGENHEARTEEIILDQSTHVNEILRKFDPDLPKRLVVFFNEDMEESERHAAAIPPFLTQVVTSQLDADRFDYLLRDAYATGTRYGEFEYKYLIAHLHLNADRGRFYLSQKAMDAAEAYVYARYHMYRAVYFHKATRSAEVMLRLAFRRFKQLIETEGPDKVKQATVPDVPCSVMRSFTARMSLNEYLALDDHTITEFLKACQDGSDAILQMLGGGLLHRHLFKSMDVTGRLSPKIAEFTEQAKAKIRDLGMDCDFCFAYDTPADAPYKPYDPDEQKPPTQIYIETSDGLREISTLSTTVQQLKKYTLVRYYFPAECRDEIDRIARATL